MEKGKVYCGYPCVGKTSIGGSFVRTCKEDHLIVDMETSLMKSDGFDRPLNWVKIYVNYVEALIDQGVYVFCSTHAKVREELENRGIEYVNVFPSLNIQDYWLCKLRDRWKNDPSNKNLLAYERAMSYYEDDIEELDKHKNKLVINVEYPYDLYEALNSYLLRNQPEYTYN